MIENPACAVCGPSHWDALGERKYALTDIPQLSPYVQKRYRVLFERWMDGEESAVIRSGMCRECGFVANLPRPDAADIDEKYRYLAELGQDYGESETPDVESRRASDVYATVAGRFPQRGTVLDFGGGDGRLMQKLAQGGHQCLLVDYNQSPRPFVRKLGDTLDDIREELSVDAIVCSHVLEHVADPVGVVRRLSTLLAPAGFMFIEVPMEIWQGPPLHEEPVTHVNFFVTSTLHRCLSEAGMHVSSCRLVASLHPTGRMLLAIRAIADKCRAPRLRDDGPNEVRRYLHPNMSSRLWRSWVTSPNPYSAILRKLSRGVLFPRKVAG